MEEEQAAVSDYDRDIIVGPLKGPDFDAPPSPDPLSDINYDVVSVSDQVACVLGFSNYLPLVIPQYERLRLWVMSI